MALKRKIDKESFETLDENKKVFYVEKGDHFELDMEDEDAGALIRAKEHEKEARKKVEAEAKALRERLAALEENDMRKRGDVEALEKSWSEKHSKAIQEAEAKAEGIKKAVRRQLLDTQAKALASEISTVPSLMSKAILERLDVDFDGENGPSLRVLDQTGKPSALTLEELKGEFVANKDFASIIIGSKASGGSATNPTNQTPVGTPNQNKPLARLSPSELKAHLESKGVK